MCGYRIVWQRSRIIIRYIARFLVIFTLLYDFSKEVSNASIKYLQYFSQKNQLTHMLCPTPYTIDVC